MKPHILAADYLFAAQHPVRHKDRTYLHHGSLSWVNVFQWLHSLL